jgi:hypothetical protein
MAQNLTPRNWDCLLTEIEDRQIVPVIGSELLRITLAPGQEEPVLLYQHIARDLAVRLEVDPSALPDPFRMNDVVWKHLGDKGAPADIYYEIQAILKSRSWPTPDPLLKLAQIRHFNLYLSVTFDPLMKKALDEARHEGRDQTEALAYSLYGKEVRDLRADFDINSEPPLVYQLFGRASTQPDYAVTDDELLAFTHRLLTRDYRPKNLYDHIRSRNLLVLGCSFPDWLARFFYCAAKGEDTFTKCIRGLVADQKTVNDSNLCQFLQRKNILIFPEPDPCRFVDELHEKWTARFGVEDNPVVKPVLFAPEAVFLSYASEDRETVLRLKKKLESAQLPVWYDQQQLDYGDQYKNKISANIRKCSVFIPVISKHTDTIEPRFFWWEWHKAMEEAEYRSPKYPFILPVVIDDTGYDAPHIPEDFKKCHWHRLTNGVPDDDFITIAAEQIKNLRRQRR